MMFLVLVGAMVGALTTFFVGRAKAGGRAAATASAPEAERAGSGSWMPAVFR